MSGDELCRCSSGSGRAGIYWNGKTGRIYYCRHVGRSNNRGIVGNIDEIPAGETVGGRCRNDCRIGRGVADDLCLCRYAAEDQISRRDLRSFIDRDKQSSLAVSHLLTDRNAVRRVVVARSANRISVIHPRLVFTALDDEIFFGLHHVNRNVDRHLVVQV